MEEAYQEKEGPEVICRVLPGAMGNKSRTRNGKRSNENHCLLGLPGVRGQRWHQWGLKMHCKTLALHRTALPVYPLLPPFTRSRRV